ncbi:hypothetical protein [Micromonospora sp. WMMD714]|uniref:hypothetical protein n=1 Tax=Micromonospora sp. WMMD714 TaxID=3016097 RepID=UPI00249C1C50|nr:hypothetical protein [Micromonospora sp. WMMD714]WFE62783.1 hypothetical protein O7625_05535 [Micromonospora sp. WMMD714]
MTTTNQQPGPLPPRLPYVPSGLFPAGPPRRPTWREPHPVTGAAVAAGGALAAAWLALFGLLGRDVSGYAWWTFVAGALAWLVSLALIRYGDRGAGTGVAIVTAGGWSIAFAVVVTRWAVSADWPMW